MRLRMPKPGRLSLEALRLLMFVAWCVVTGAISMTGATLAQDQAGDELQSVEVSATDNPAESSTTWGTRLRRALWIFVMLSIAGLVLLIGTVLFLFWRAKQLVENAVKPDLPALERLVAKKRVKHPSLGPKRLSKKLIHRQAMRAGLVGFATGVGGLPTLPIAIPIDLAATIKLQSNLVHMLRLTTGGKVRAEDVSEASLWLVTSGGQELATASGVMIRKLVVRLLSKSLLKFVPLVGGLVGFAMNWASTQAIGRLTLLWLDGQAGPAAGS